MTIENNQSPLLCRYADWHCVGLAYYTSLAKRVVANFQVLEERKNSGLFFSITAVILYTHLVCL